jgi:hypothetical protein
MPAIAGEPVLIDIDVTNPGQGWALRGQARFPVLRGVERDIAALRVRTASEAACRALAAP